MIDRGKWDDRHMDDETMSQILDRCRPDQWRAAGWVLTRATDARCTRQGHPLVEVFVGFEVGMMCGRCGRVILTGRINEKLAKFASTRKPMQEAS